MSRFSQSEAEAAGWSIVHQRDEYEVVVGPNLTQKHPATIVAEKYISRPGEVGRLIHEEAETMGKLLERIHAWEQHQKNIDAAGENVQPAPVDTDSELKTFSFLSGDEAEGVGEPVQSVVVPAEPGDLTLEAEVTTLTDAEWSARSRNDTLVTDEGQVVHGGGGEAVVNAEELRLLNKKAIEDRRAAEPAHGPTEQLSFDTAGLVDTPGIGAGGTVIVREGEALDEVASRKEDLKKMREEGRVASMAEQGQAIAPEGADKLAGLDVGIQERGDLGSEVPGQGAVARTLEESEDGEHPAPHLYPEGEPIVSEAPDEPATAGEAEARSEAEEDAAKEQRDEGLAEAESDEANAAVREAGMEAAEAHAEEQEQNADESKDEPEDSFTEADDVEATDAAKAKAEELGVDLSEVEGSGKDGRITAPDVEAAAESKSE